MSGRTAVGVGATVVLLAAGLLFGLANRGPKPAVVTAGSGVGPASTAAAAASTSGSTETASPPPSPIPGLPTVVPPPTPSPWVGAPVACGSLSLPGNGLPGRQTSATATLANVTARLTGTSTDPRTGEPALDPAILTVSVGGVRALSGQVTVPTGIRGDQAAPATTVIPWGLSGTRADPAGADSSASSVGWSALCLARFAGASQPTVLLGLDTGAAHCCSFVLAYGISGTAVAPSVHYVFGNASGNLQTEGDQAVLVTADDSFDYQFTSFADSGAPVEVLEFTGGAFVNVTHQYPDLVRADAAQWWSRSWPGPAPTPAMDPLGTLAAWAADECTLGAGSSAFATLNQLAAQGKLVVDPAVALPGKPQGAAYVSTIKAFLYQHGYC